jgi:hypothetical protein
VTTQTRDHSQILLFFTHEELMSAKTRAELKKWGVRRFVSTMARLSRWGITIGKHERRKAVLALKEKDRDAYDALLTIIVEILQENV